MYLGYFVQWITEALASVGDAVQRAFYTVTHDPFWCATTLALIVALVLWFFSRSRSRR